MERERPPYREMFQNEHSSSVWPTVLVGLVLLAAIAGALIVYRNTLAGWERRFGDKPQPTAHPAIERTPEALPPALTDEDMARIIEQERKREAEDAKSLRCINGQLFRRLPNGWENLPGRYC